MIYRFRAIIPNKIYRGSAPSPQDVKWLKDHYNINKIVSLDKEAGEKISRTCQLLGIQQVKLYMEDLYNDVFKLLKQNLKDLLLKNNPTFLHCHLGKDRSSLLSALFECKYLGKNPNKAIQEAKELGFGIGIPEPIVKLYEKIIKSCKPSKDQNSADIVSNEREYKGDPRDSYLDTTYDHSFSPYLSQTKQYPYENPYLELQEQSPTRENYKKKNLEKDEKEIDENMVPMVGQYNNMGGIRGAGPSGGFIYD